MSSEWTSVPLGQLCHPERGITYGIVKVGDFVPDGVPVIRGGDIRDGTIVCDDSKRVSEEVSNQFRRTILKGGEGVGDVLEEDEAQHQVLVFGGVHVGAQLVGCRPEGLLDVVEHWR